MQMAGQLFVREIEVKRAKHSLINDPPPDSFVNLPFVEAIEFFRSKPHVTPDEFTAMMDEERFRSFTMRLTASETIREQARKLLSIAMQPDGIGLREFQREVIEDSAKLGITPNSHGYLETVYRTNTAVSYNAGRYKAQTDPDVVRGTGYWQYLTVDDDRVRDDHAPLHLKTWRIGDREAERVYPPNGYNCRCAVVVLDPEDVEEEHLNRSVDARDAVTDGFRGNPAGMIREEADA